MFRFVLNNLRRIVVLLLLIHSASGVHADETITAADLSRFAALARSVAAIPISERPSPEMAEALELLLSASIRISKQDPGISDEQLMKRLAPFKQRLDPDKKADGEMAPGWFDVTLARRAGLLAAAVTMGAVSRLKVIEAGTGAALAVPEPMRWLYRFHQRPAFTVDGSLVVISESVQDAGVREALRIDLLQRQERRLILRQTLQRLFVLGARPPADLRGGRLVVESVDQPKAFFTSNSDTHFGRKETFSIESGGLRLVGEERRDPELRAVDAWLTAAKGPNASQAQRKARRLLPEPEMLGDVTVSRSVGGNAEVVLTFDSSRLRFVLRKAAHGYDVVSASRIEPAGKR